MISIADQKKQLRKEIHERIKQCPLIEREKLSKAAVSQLLNRPEWHKAKCICAYLPLADEMDLRPALEAALEAGKMVSLPRYMPEEGKYCAAIIDMEFKSLVKGMFGLLEPHPDVACVPLNRLDFVLVPGVAFDDYGHRLGRGKGFYDRLLADVVGVKCGVALDDQIICRVPAESHDIRMNFILTPTQWLTIEEATPS
jgi:5-formyltetrahydrofolate cyclo-ligase